jgi:GTP-binding protein
VSDFPETRVVDAQFITTAVAPEGYPREDLPEVAFVGRSNVGKSSMINALAGRRKLVRVSNTPGRTRTLNFFNVIVTQNKVRHTVRFADLPGYGYAKVGKGERKSWETMIDAYLRKRDCLRIVVSIVDAEVGPTEADFHTLDYLNASQRKILCVATKLDRLPKAKRKPRLLELSQKLELPRELVVGFSAVENLGRDEVWNALLGELTHIG